MKLFLSSYRIPNSNSFSNFVGKKLNDIKLGLIFNAKDHKPTEERKRKLDEHLVYFKALGIQVEEIDLREYKEQSGILDRLKEFDVLWLNGGNTYSLRLAIANSGMDNILKDVLGTNLIYAGDSAGAIVAGPTLKYYDAADDPAVVPKVIYEGLGLTDIAILPHWGSEEYGKVLGGIEERLEKDGYKTMRLKDEDYVMIHDGKIVQ